MELRHLRYFIAVAEELHFGRAAERLGISQPPLSQQIQALEEEIGARLFERTNRRVELTDAGRLFLDESRQVLAQVDKAVLLARRAHLGELGELKIGFTSSAPFTSTIPSSIHAFRKAYPDVHLDLQEMSSRQVLKALLEESLQVGVIRPLALPDAVHWVELFREPLVAVLRADHPLAAGSEDGLAIAALAEEPFVFFPRSYGTGLYDQVIAPDPTGRLQSAHRPGGQRGDDHHRPGLGWTGGVDPAGVVPPHPGRRRGLPHPERSRGDDCGMAGPSAERGLAAGAVLHRPGDP